MKALLGARVIRNAARWQWANQDGGDGMCGTIRGVENVMNKESKGKRATVIVVWDVGNAAANYDARDLLVVDMPGLSHTGCTCAHCHESPIAGLRYECRDCRVPVNLCTACYHNDQHKKAHQFDMYAFTGDQRRTLLPPTRKEIASQERIRPRGLFVGALVTKGVDWGYADQERHIAQKGMMKKLQAWKKHHPRSAALVEWRATKATNIYRLGYHGRLDLSCIKAAKATFKVYRQHLFSVDSILNAMRNSEQFLSKKNKSKCTLASSSHTGSMTPSSALDDLETRSQSNDIDSEKAYFTEARMIEDIEKYVNDNDCASLATYCSTHKAKLHSSLAAFISRLAFDCVRRGHLDMALLLCEYAALANNCSVALHKDSNFNTALHLLAKHTDQASTSDAPFAGLDDLVAYLLGGGTERLGLANRQGLNCVHYAVVHGHRRLMRHYLHRLNAAGDWLVNATQSIAGDALAAVHLAVVNDDAVMLRLIVDEGHANINRQTSASYRTPLHLAVKLNHRLMVETCVELGADLKLPDCQGDTPLHYAMRQWSTTNLDDVTSDEQQKLLTEALVSYLVLNGGNISAKNVRGRTPLDMAPHLDVAEQMFAWQKSYLHKIAVAKSTSRDISHREQM